MTSGPFLGLFYIGTNFLQAFGNVLLSTIVSALRQGILLIPLLYAMNAILGETGNVTVHVISDIIAALIAVGLALRQYRILKFSIRDDIGKVIADQL